MNFISFKVYMYYIQCCVCFSDESDLDDDDYLGDQRSSLYNHTGSHYSRSPRSLSSSSTQDSGHSPRPIQINGASKYTIYEKMYCYLKKESLAVKLGKRG